jgi:ketopantoate reductase
VDLLNGRKTEVDFIYGSVIQIAEEKKFHSDSQSPAWIGQSG